MSDGAVLYFHGASSQRDLGPSEADSEAAAVPVLRHVRPGYDASPPSPHADLRQIAAEALDRTGHAFSSLVLMGWSGGGPYALAGGAIGHPAVRGIVLLGSWAPMEPPDPDLPRGVRVFMRLGRRAPRPILRAGLAVAGLRNPGHVDDVHRVARPWGFALDDVAARLPVAAWHAERDREVPIAPWARRERTIELHRIPGSTHQPSSATWRDALGWAAALLGDRTAGT